MFPTGTIAALITTDRIREAEAARHASQSNRTEPAEPRRARRLRLLAMRVATPDPR
jgi:hypothetical protein